MRSRCWKRRRRLLGGWHIDRIGVAALKGTSLFNIRCMILNRNASDLVANSHLPGLGMMVI